jgi:hypothetical protein
MLPTNSFISLLYPHCINIIKNKPIESVSNTEIKNMFNTVTTFNEKYINKKNISNINFTNLINNKIIINRGFDHTNVRHDLSSNTNLITQIDKNKFVLHEYIHLDLRTDLIPVLHYKLMFNDKIVMNLTKTDYTENYKIIYDNKNIIETLNKIEKKIKK